MHQIRINLHKRKYKLHLKNIKYKKMVSYKSKKYLLKKSKIEYSDQQL